jgi:thiol:disulfide interchange protein DsbA
MKKVIFGLMALVMMTSACAQNNKSAETSKWKEGEHYEIVSEEASASPKVTEFFSHYCGHCFQFERFVDTVKQAVQVPFEKSHVSYIPKDDSLVAMAMVKAYVIMQELEVEESVSPQMFAAIHMTDEQIASEEAIKNIFLLNEVDSDVYDALFASEEVNQKAKEMSELWLEKRITSVPTLVVNDKYKINMGSVSSMDELIELTVSLTKMKE